MGRWIMANKPERNFNVDTYLSSTGPGRRILRVKAAQSFSSQGERADCLFYLQTGRAKLTVVSRGGKEATVTLLAAGDFFGEECMAGPDERRTTSATAITACAVLEIACDELTRVVHEENEFSDWFVQFIAQRGARTQADLIDQLFNNSERRLARTLLLMSEYGNSAGPLKHIPPVTQGTLAEIIGTTRSRVSFFMNRFRNLGYISYNGRIQVHKSLLSMVLLDQLPEQNASRPPLLDPTPSPALTAKRAKMLPKPHKLPRKR
jgi:CRP/FNR family cyclic AMP-dependent transcriptional regulator